MGSFRSVPDTTKETMIKQGVNLTYAVTHMCGWRIYMEDAHLSISPLSDKKNSLFAVFDGHGGAEVAAFVERHFVVELEKNPLYKEGQYQKALRETFMQMDRLLLENAGKTEITQIQKEMREKENGAKYDEESHAGCTANVVLVTPEFIFCANSGDSRSVACIEGKVVELSHDHKPEDAIELNRINNAGGMVSCGRVNGGLNLSRALGDLEYKKNAQLGPQLQMITANPDIKQIPNVNIDFIIMGCDGIWQIKTNSQMVEWVSKRMANATPQEKIIEELLDDLVSKDSGNQYGMDNMSCILIKFNNKK